ncbi:TonB-dependent siderophore receptor [Pseudoduganella umbonata]|uniref:Iron complex outermembrane receptor protein n=1 Tax=Pseudoduganella umbonata TaxID=864828 RepID=A0A4P8HP21_9BURK|nr:TonB-dependent siderophore receptor [Pseudoduganella umbonata]MBB3220223.1 iron complex outermembrane receptor protein [Pseudoduganella umbonata]QCP10204.1 TonB-dependent siderophore receptor [Pseudoduganella umbonata]
MTAGPRFRYRRAVRGRCAHCAIALAALAAAALPLSSPLAADAGSVVIDGQRGGYRTLAVAGATKTDALPKDLPQSVRTLTAELLQDAGVTSLAGALDLASGIARQSDLGGLWDSYAMRGFTGDPNFGSDYMVNGFAASRGYNGLRDIAGTQAVEILKGPASALYGRGEPGGTVNILTKKPRFAPRYALEAGVASHATRRVAADLTGPLSDAVAYRLNAAHQGGDNFRGLHTDRDYVAPSLLWLAGPDTTVSYELEASRQRSPFDRGIPVLDGGPGVPVERFLGEPADGPVTVKSLGHQLFVQHGLGNAWSLQGGAAYRDSSLAGYSTEANDVLPDGHTLRRQRRLRDWSATDRSARAELLGSVSAFGARHALLFGVDAYRFDDSRVQLRRNPTTANPYAIDLYAPAYGNQAAPLALSIDTLEHQRAHAVYAQDQVTINEQWKLLAGVRHDRYRQTVINHRTAAVNAQALSATSPRAGIVWQPSGSLSLYASAARGFRPNSGISIGNTAFPAERSVSYELGAKVDTRGGLAGTLALYRIDKENVLAVNPVNTDFAVAAGEVASKGLELDVSGELARGVCLSAAYAYTDAQVTRGDSAIATGSRLPNVARHSGNLLLVAGNAVASLGGGVAYVGERRGDVATSSGFTLPGYTTARLLAAWLPSKQLRLAVNVDNLFDRRYYASSYSRLWVAPGSTRTAALTATYVF